MTNSDAHDPKHPEQSGTNSEDAVSGRMGEGKNTLRAERLRRCAKFYKGIKIVKGTFITDQPDP